LFAELQVLAEYYLIRLVSLIGNNPISIDCFGSENSLMYSNISTS
jgi:hypothetical protein